MFSILSLSQDEWFCKDRKIFLFRFFLLSFCLIKKKQKIKATKIPPAQSDRLTNATLASKTALIFLLFFLSCCGFSNRLPTSVRKSLQSFTLFRLVCGLCPRTCAVFTLNVRRTMKTAPEERYIGSKRLSYKILSLRSSVIFVRELNKNALLFHLSSSADCRPLTVVFFNIHTTCFLVKRLLLLFSD